MLQIYWTEKIEPIFTEDNKNKYNQFGLQQVKPVGKDANSRRLFRATGTKEYIDKAIAFLIVINKEPIICGVADINGVQHGQVRLFTGFDEDNEPIFEIQDILDEDGNPMAKYPYNLEEVSKHFEPYTVQNIEGDDVIMTPPNNIAAGWTNLADFKK